MSELSLADLIENRTLSAGMAATLEAAVRQRESILVAAIPRLAGKSTLLRAALATDPTVEVHALSTYRGPGLGIPSRPDGSYLLVAEIAPTGFPDYLWDEDARRVFEAAHAGFPLATALHAGGAASAFRILEANGIPDEHAAAIDLFVYVRSFGHWRSPARRVVASIEHIEGVRDGHPSTRLLHRWDESSDRFESLDP